MKSNLKLLVYMKENEWTDLAKKYLENNFERITYRCGESLADDYAYQSQYESLEPDWIVSFLSPWILPPHILKEATIGAINFHPGPPEYPGIGCYNFAIWEDAEFYGVTCHFMIKKVDAGPIIKTIGFPLIGNETVEILRQKSMMYLLILFYEIMGKIWLGQELKPDGVQWSRKALTRKDLQELCCGNRLFWDSLEFENIEKYLRATYFPEARDPPYIEVNGRKWRLEPF